MQNISAATERNKNDDAMDVDEKVIIYTFIYIHKNLCAKSFFVGGGNLRGMGDLSLSLSLSLSLYI